MIENLDKLIARLEHDLTFTSPGEQQDVTAERITKLKQLRQQQRRQRISDARKQLNK